MNLLSDPITVETLKSLLNEQWISRLGEDLFRRRYWSSIVAGINATINKGSSVIPRKNQIFASLNRFDGGNFRVLMIGQDPYPTPGNATGFAFASASGRPVPASLKQVFKEIDQEYGSKMYETLRFNGNLDSWIDQGVMLLNTALTIGVGNESHRDIGWNDFVSDVIEYLDQTYVFVTIALGSNAAKVASDHVHKNKSLIITAGHPSPMNRSRPFLGCKCFEQANAKLMSVNLLPVSWIIKRDESDD